VHFPREENGTAGLVRTSRLFFTSAVKWQRTHWQGWRGWRWSHLERAAAAKGGQLP